jgi:uncharacterized protein (DUF1015 family)
VTDPRRDKHVDFVGGIRGTPSSSGASTGREMTDRAAPVPDADRRALAVSDAGLLMPPKSTWFEPKLRSGLFVHTF